jgi:hypothetical protein
LQYFDLVVKGLADRGTPLPQPEETKQHFINAGFVDIKVIEKPIDIGDWRGGLDPSF